MAIFNSDEFPYPVNLIRFGLQRKKEFLRDVRGSFDGLVIPANILLYQYKATPSLVHMCKDKLFFIDPMSYLFGQTFETFKKKIVDSTQFKPSFEKLMVNHGLDIKSFLNYDYDRLLTFIDSNRINLNQFVDNCLNFQLNTISDNLKEFASDLVDDADFESDFYKPAFVIPPYFLIDSENPAFITTKINFDILNYTKNLALPKPVYPMVFIKKSLITYPEIINKIIQDFKTLNYEGYVLWIDNFRETKVSSSEEIINIIEAVKKLSEKKSDVIMMYGGYFSLLLYKLGLSGICHGLAISESRGAKDSLRKHGGKAPIRYYIRKLHEFFTTENAVLILKEEPDLICKCPVCRRIVKNDPNNIPLFDEEESLAEMHFLYNRSQEKKEIASSDLRSLIENIRITKTTYVHIERILKPYKKPDGSDEQRPIINLEYLDIWADALQRYVT